MRWNVEYDIALPLAEMVTDFQQLRLVNKKAVTAPPPCSIETDTKNELFFVKTKSKQKLLVLLNFGAINFYSGQKI